MLQPAAPAARSVRVACAPSAQPLLLLHPAALLSAARRQRRRRANCTLACNDERAVATGVRVRPLRTADFATVASLQSSVFYEPRLPFALPLMDAVLHPLFRFDVANTLRRKLRYTVLNRHARRAVRQSVTCALLLGFVHARLDSARGLVTRRHRFCALVALHDRDEAVLGVLEARAARRLLWFVRHAFRAACVHKPQHSAPDSGVALPLCSSVCLHSGVHPARPRWCATPRWSARTKRCPREHSG
jgi:hypothetical protein